MIKDKIKKYLLGELSEIEAEGFEEEYSLDEKIFEEFRAVESELIDDYLTHKLSLPERKLFEINYLNSEARLEKIESARIFLEGIKAENAKSDENNHFGFFGFLENQIFLRFAFGGLFVLILLGVCAYIVHENYKTPEIVKLYEPEKKVEPEIGKSQNENAESQKTLKKNDETTAANDVKQPRIAENSKTPIPAKPAPLIETKSVKNEKTVGFVLQPENLRSEGEQFIKFSGKTTKVNLKLELPAETEKYESYQVTLKNAEGETITKQVNLKNPNITLSAEKLDNQTYIIFLEGKKAKKPTEPITEFTFRVRR